MSNGPAYLPAVVEGVQIHDYRHRPADGRFGIDQRTNSSGDSNFEIVAYLAVADSLKPQIRRGHTNAPMRGCIDEWPATRARVASRA